MIATTLVLFSANILLLFEGLPGVLFVLPDSYVDPEYKDYGGKLLIL